jgi:hypothetical protein
MVIRLGRGTSERVLFDLTSAMAFITNYIIESLLSFN